MFVVPRIYFSLHPDVVTNADPNNRLDSAHALVLLASSLGFTCLYIWLYTIGSRIEMIRHRRRQEVL
jgi:hypothetical protein